MTSKLKLLTILATVLWCLVPIRAISQLMPGLEPIAERLTGKSIDYLLMLTTMAAIGCTGYVVRAFIAYTIKTKAESEALSREHAAALKALHESTRLDLRDAVTAINNLVSMGSRERDHRP